MRPQNRADARCGPRQLKSADWMPYSCSFRICRRNCGWPSARQATFPFRRYSRYEVFGTAASFNISLACAMSNLAGDLAGLLTAENLNAHLCAAADTPLGGRFIRKTKGIITRAEMPRSQKLSRYAIIGD